MSNLRSISEGSFVLGDTNGLTFEAGSGISISEPSEGTVRIANDETVLYSGAFTASANASTTISEDITNFERIRIYAARGTDTRAPKCTEFSPISVSASPYCIESTFYNSANEFYSDRAQLRFNGTTMSCNVAARVKILNNAITVTSDAPLTVTKVVGVNRIGGNA